MAITEETRNYRERETSRGVEITTEFQGDANSTLENENLQRNNKCPEHTGFYISESLDATPPGTSRRMFRVRAFRPHHIWDRP